jgi:hypothetical protein
VLPRVARWFICFKTKNHNLGKFGKIWESLGMETVGLFYGHLVFLGLLGIFYGILVYFMVIWYMVPRFGMLYEGKSGNPDATPT